MLAEHIDDIAVIRRWHADLPITSRRLLLMNCGEAGCRGRAWIMGPYGLGTVNQNLPALCHVSGRLSHSGITELQSAFLPAFTGTYINTSTTRSKSSSSTSR